MSVYSIFLSDFGIEVCPPEWRVVEKNCRHHRLYYIYGGEAVYESEHERVALYPGKLYLLPVNIGYVAAHNAAAPLHCLWFHFTTYPVVRNDIIEIDPVKLPALLHLMKAAEHFVYNHPAETQILTNLLESILFLFDSVSNLVTCSDIRIEKAMNDIHKNYMQDISIKELANKVNLNECHFIRIFNNITGVTPYKYLSAYRFRIAASLLKNNCTVELAAEQIGFKDPKIFTRAFRKNFGVTPSEFKKTHTCV